MTHYPACLHADSNGYEEAVADEEDADEDGGDEDDEEGTPPKKAPNKRKAGARNRAEVKEPKKRRASTNGGSGGGSALSAALQKFLGVERLARPQVRKFTVWPSVQSVVINSGKKLIESPVPCQPSLSLLCKRACQTGLHRAKLDAWAIWLMQEHV